MTSSLATTVAVRRAERLARARRRILVGTLAVIAALAFGIASSAAFAAEEPAQPDPQTPRFDESVDVSLATTSIYVVDAKGQPIVDLRPEEVEVIVGGKALPLAHFEKAAAPEEAAPSAVRMAAPPSPTAAPALPRHVFLFFDLAFSLPRGVVAAKKVASGLIDGFPASDQLYLVTFDSQHGMDQQLGPVRDRVGRHVLRERIEGLQPNVERLRRRVDLPSVAGVGVKSDGGLMADTYTAGHNLALGEYAAQGAALADGLRSFATFLRQLPGPKVLLFFSQGIDSDIYGGQYAASKGRDRHGNLRSAFEPALHGLAETGAMLLFVDPVVGFDANDRVEGVAFDAEAHWVNDAPTGAGSLQLMSETSGGVVVRDPNLETMGARLDGWLRSRYELGVYLPPGQEKGQVAADIRVNRPGVRAWTASWLQRPRTVGDMTPAERAFLAVMLVMSSDARSALRNVAAPPLVPLQGVPSSSLQGDALNLRFQPDEWSADMLLRGLELHSVVVAPGDPPRVVALEHRMLTPTLAREAVEAHATSAPDLVWGLVAFDLGSGKILFGRYPVAPTPSPTPSR